MKANNNGTDISHNVQIAVDNKADLVVEIDVTSSPADQGQLSNMAIKSKKELDVEELIALADKGYWNGKVKGGSYMHFLIYNIKRVCKIKNIKDIIEAIKAKEKEIITETFVTISFFSNFLEERVAEDVDPYNF